MTAGWIAFLILIIVFILLLLVGIIDGNRYIKVNNEFVLPKLKDNVKFVFISDLHDKVYGKNNEGLIRDIKNAKPDFIIIGGDLITSHLNESYRSAIDFVNELSKDFTIYYSFGNHESKIKDWPVKLPGKYEELLNGVKDKTVILDNESIYLDKYNLRISGFEVPLKYFKRFKKFELPLNELENKVGKRDENEATILVAHAPEFFETYAKWNADLVLAGHVHGGIMRLPLLGGVISPSFTLFPKYDGGIFKENKTTMLLSRGLGAHSIPLRFFNPAELHIVNCLKES